MKFADLHLHTVFSDGTYLPQDLILEARRNDLSAIAVADHDTVDGLESTIEAGNKEAVEVIPAIELTAEYETIEIHILGYFLDYRNKGLIERLDVLKKNRIERIYKIADKLNAIGVKLDVQEVFKLGSRGTVGRLHIARAMVKQGLVNSIYEAFAKYIGDKCPAYVCGFRFSPQEAINLIKEVRGIPVLAHPYTISCDELIPEFIDYGLMGLEVYYPEHTQSMINFYLNLAQKYHLLITGGSDCHGDAKPQVKIGSVKLPYELVEKLKIAQENL